MKIFNPSAPADPVMTKAGQIAGRLETYFTNNPGKRFVTGDQVRAALPEDAADLTDGMLSQIAQLKGWRFEL